MLPVCNTLGLLCYYCRTLKGFCILIVAFMKRGVQLSLLQLSFVSLRCGAITAKAVRFKANAPLELKFMSLIVTACWTGIKAWDSGLSVLSAKWYFWFFGTVVDAEEKNWLWFVHCQQCMHSNCMSIAAHWHRVLTNVLAHTAYLYRHAGITSLR